MSYKFVLISDKYIDYLRKTEPRVMSNKAESRIYHRKYLGIIQELNGFKYFIPLSSDSEIINYDLNDEGDLKYKLIVFNELYFVRQNKDKIERTAKNLYESKTNNLKEQKGRQSLLEITLDFKMMEILCSSFDKK